LGALYQTNQGLTDRNRDEVPHGTAEIQNLARAGADFNNLYRAKDPERVAWQDIEPERVTQWGTKNKPMTQKDYRYSKRKLQQMVGDGNWYFGKTLYSREETSDRIFRTLTVWIRASDTDHVEQVSLWANRF
jgi:hypothetical protein